MEDSKHLTAFDNTLLSERRSAMKRKGLLISSIFFVILLFIGRNVRASEVRGVTDNSIKVATIAPVTGPAGSLGLLWVEATKNYIRYVNDNGGVNGRQLDLIVEDDRYSIPLSLTAFKKLVYKDKIFALIGPSSTGALSLLRDKIRKEKLPTMSFITPEIAFSPPHRYIFGVTDTYPGQVKVLIDYMIKDLKLKEPRIALVYPDVESGKVDMRAALARLGKYDIEPVTKDILTQGAIDATSQVMSIKRSKANVIAYVGGFTATTVTLLRDLRKLGLNVPVVGSYGTMLGEEINAIGKVANQFYAVHATSPWYGKGSGLQKMRKITLKYHPGTGKPCRGTIYTGLWICNTMVVEGLKRAGRNVNGEALIKAFESIKNYDTGGLCGPLSYSPTNHKGGDSWKIFKADPTGRKYIPMTDWRTPD